MNGSCSIGFGGINGSGARTSGCATGNGSGVSFFSSGRGTGGNFANISKEVGVIELDGSLFCSDTTGVCCFFGIGGICGGGRSWLVISLACGTFVSSTVSVLGVGLSAFGCDDAGAAVSAALFIVRLIKRRPLDFWDGSSMEMASKPG